MAKKRLVKPRVWLFMMSAMVLIFACVYASQGQFIARQTTRLEELESEYARKLSENAQIERKIAFAKTDAYVERVAHDMGLLKEGEIRFVAGNAPTDE